MGVEMFVEIRGRYIDRYGEYSLPNFSTHVLTNKEAVLWAAREIERMEKKYDFSVMECEVYEYYPSTGETRIINKLF